MLRGEIDMANAPSLAHELSAYIDATKPKDVIVDASGLVFMDSSGFAVLIRAASRLASEQREIRIEGLVGVARRAGTLLGLGAVLGAEVAEHE
jgi:stage II sporulation protein AA (anti-sigma F factor antagonist)